MAYQYHESDRKALASRSFDGWAFYFNRSTPTLTDIPAPHVTLKGSSFVFDDPAWFPVFDAGASRSQTLSPSLFLKVIRWSRLFQSDDRPLLFARVRLARPQGKSRKNFKEWLYVARFI